MLLKIFPWNLVFIIIFNCTVVLSLVNNFTFVLILCPNHILVLELIHNFTLVLTFYLICPLALILVLICLLVPSISIPAFGKQFRDNFQKSNHPKSLPYPSKFFRIFWVELPMTITNSNFIWKLTKAYVSSSTPQQAILIGLPWFLDMF